ncbi:MAG: sulfatase-like hydrolase/transferase [Acidobacteria bacterium]|nr:sulfatase-like hydrolase/transferase [Candidatus Sulfomarinibacter kjeldsenii]
MLSSTSIVRLAALTTILLSFGLGCGSGTQPEAAQEHVQAGNQLLAEGRIGPATAEFEKAVRLDPEFIEAHVQLANIVASRGQVGAAEIRFKTLLDRHPDNSMVLAGWGRLLAATGRLEQAQRVLHHAVESDPPSTEAAVDLARVLTALGRNEEATAAFVRAADLGASESPTFLLDWADFLQRQNDMEDSLTKIEQAASIAPDDPAVLEALGRAYLDSGRPGEALNILQRALAATHGESPLYETRRQVLLRASASTPRATARPDMPNVLLVVIDTLRADHVGAYGYGYPTTPNMDLLADHAVVFETVVSQAPWTAPAMASLFTGLYPSVHGLDGGIVWGEGAISSSGGLPFAVQKVLPPGHQTLAEVFRQAGYSTAGFVSNLYVNSIFGFAQGFDFFDDEYEDYNFDQGEVKRRADVTNERVFEWLRAGLEEPFFLLVHYNDPHWPYEPPSPYGESFVTGYSGSFTPTKTREVVVTHREVPPPISDQDLAYIVGLYDGEIQYVDAHLGRLLEAVRELPTERDLVTALTADHGEEFLDHGAFNHGYTLYEEQTLVPFIVSAPSRFNPRRVSQQVRLIDAAPTLLEMAGVENRNTKFQGRSLVPLMAGLDLEPLDAFSEATNVGSQSALRSTDSQKLIHSLIDPKWLLFDLGSDAEELHDLAAQRMARMRELAARLEAWREENRALRSQINIAETGVNRVVLDEEMQKGLKALGYIQE